MIKRRASIHLKEMHLKCDTLPLCRSSGRRDFIPSYTMKKTLLLLSLAASLGLAYAAGSNSTNEDQSVALTFSNTERQPANIGNSGGSYCGVAFTLSNDPTRFDVTCEGLTEVPSFSTFDLESISIKVRGGQSWADTAAYIIDDTSNTVLAHSTNTTGTLSGGDMASFQFDSLTLNVDTGYKLIFVDASQIDEAYIAVGENLTGNYRQNRQMAAFSTGESTSMTECGFPNGIDGTTSNGYAPVVSIQGRTQLIPEPTTATLSLLALAGLVARRRRK